MNVEEHTIAGRISGLSRQVTLAVPETAEPKKLCVFLDAEFYLQRLNALPIISSLQAAGEIPAVACLFISHVDAHARHHDFTCNADYATFVAEDVFAWARQRLSSLAETEHLIAGLSLSALQSAYILLEHSPRFSTAICQSGSFWWNDEWLTRNLPANCASGRYYVSVGNRETEADVSHPPTGLKQEVSQFKAVARFAERLRERDATVRFEVFDGGHEIEPWQSELPSALRWLLGEPQ